MSRKFSVHEYLDTLNNNLIRSVSQKHEINGVEVRAFMENAIAQIDLHVDEKGNIAKPGNAVAILHLRYRYIPPKEDN